MSATALTPRCATSRPGWPTAGSRFIRRGRAPGAARPGLSVLPGLDRRRHAVGLGRPAWGCAGRSSLGAGGSRSGPGRSPPPSTGWSGPPEPAASSRASTATPVGRGRCNGRSSVCSGCSTPRGPTSPQRGRPGRRRGRVGSHGAAAAVRRDLAGGRRPPPHRQLAPGRPSWRCTTPWMTTPGCARLPLTGGATPMAPGLWRAPLRARVDPLLDLRRRHDSQRRSGRVVLWNRPLARGRVLPVRVHRLPPRHAQSSPGS